MLSVEVLRHIPMSGGVETVGSLNVSMDRFVHIEGKDGLTPYINEFGYWQVGEEDTGIEAQGPQGIQGIKGEKGDKGDTGDKGETGPQGLKGDKGDKGNAFLYTDFTGDQLALLKGEKGETGPQGIQGIQGIKGIKGIKGDKGDKGDAGQNIINQNDSKPLKIWVGTQSEYDLVTKQADTLYMVKA